MSFAIQGLIGDRVRLDELGLPFVELPQGKAFVPFTKTLLDRFRIPWLPMTEEGRNSIPPEIEKIVARTSGLVAYIEAEFFGGTGTQASSVWKDGTIIGGPTLQRDAVNLALGLLGTMKSHGKDEFDSLELGRYNDTEDWTHRQEPY